MKSSFFYKFTIFFLIISLIALFFPYSTYAYSFKNSEFGTLTVNVEGRILPLSDTVSDDKVWTINAGETEPSEVDMEALKERVLQINNGVLPNFTKPNMPSDLNKINLRNEFSLFSLGQESTRSAFIYSVNTPTNYPYCAVCRVSSSSAIGSGFMVSANKLLTAAHCIIDENGNIRSNLAFCPAYNNGVWNNMTSGWQNLTWGNYPTTGASGGDWCVVTLDWSMGNTVGNFGCVNYDPASQLQNLSITLYGYPGAFNGSQGYSVGTITDPYNTMFLHDAMTVGGMSGGPVARYDNYAVGINQGYLTSDVTTSVSCKINQDIINLIVGN